MQMNIKRAIYKFLGLVYPEKCACCGRVIEPDELLCEYCVDMLPRIKAPVCTFCGAAKFDCKCKKEHNGYDSIVAPFYYKGVISRAIRDFKFNSKQYVYRFLGLEMAKCLEREFKDTDFDFICCVPMTEKKKKERGFNQSEMLAKEVGRILSVEYCDALEKLYDIPDQHGLRADERLGNVIGVFDVKPDIDVCGKRVLLCDDIKTTGATLGECAKMLKLAGAQSVDCITAAVTPKQEEE